MPAPLDLTGRRFGGLVVLGQAGKVHFGRTMTAWRVRCDCGREEVYPQNRLPHADYIYRTRHVVTACSVCRQPPCIVCGEPVPIGSRANTCSEVCADIKRRRIQRDSYHRRAAADPNFNRRRHEARLARAAADPAYARHLAEIGRLAQQRRREREAADPTLADQRRQRARRWYAKHAARIQAKRRQRLAGLEPAALERWLKRQRAYGRAYRRRWRADLFRHPERHRAYLDKQREYRRQREVQANRRSPHIVADQRQND